MASPPPVPPKDTPYRTSFMDADRPISTPASGSKRKREASDSQLYNFPSGHLEAPDADAHTPKRSRPHLQPSDNSASDDATPVQRNVRRKKGVNNLSNLNLRHAAERQAQLQAESQSQLVPRESRFQEGSLTDRPSDQPPSAFTRVPRTDSGNLSQVDDLMDDYHNGMPTPRKTVEIEYAREQAQIPQQTATTTLQPVGSEDNNGFFYRFGRQIASTFHPVRLWKQVWEESHEEIRLENIAKLERKRALKEEAERRYAQMKAEGQFGGRTVSRASAASNVTTRDSGVILAGGMSSEHKRDVSYDSQAASQINDTSTRHENEAYDPTASVVRTLKSRLTFKRPSIQNLQFGIKRTKSDFNLAAAASSQRETSSSASPTKAEFGESALRKSKSKIDIRRQHKLSKRVSDLETKLNRARSELDSALNEASPMSKLGNNHQRFTPYSSLRRPKFKPGKLESLPSERLLDPSQFNFELDDVDQVMEHRAKAAADLEGGSSERPKGVDLMDTTDENDEETIRMSRARPYPPRASSIFKLNNDNIEDVTQDKVVNTDHDTTAGAGDTAQNEEQNDKMDIDNNPTIEVTQPDNEPENVGTEIAKDQSKPEKAASYANLDAKLKALDANVKLASKKPPKSKKRKSGDKEDLKDYRPGDDDEDDEDAEWDKFGARPKRRKSSGITKKKSARKSAGGSEDVTAVDDQTEVAITKTTDVEVGETNDDIKEVPIERPVRASIDSQHAILEPVFEEEHEESAAINGDPVKKAVIKPTHSRNPSMEAGAEEELMTRAAAAARKHRSHSPSGGEKTSLGDAVDGAAKQPAVADNVTKRSRSRSAKKGKKNVDESFEWPEDVF